MGMAPRLASSSMRRWRSVFLLQRRRGRHRESDGNQKLHSGGKLGFDAGKAGCGRSAAEAGKAGDAGPAAGSGKPSGGGPAIDAGESGGDRLAGDEPSHVAAGAWATAAAIHQVSMGADPMAAVMEMHGQIMQASSKQSGTALGLKRMPAATVTPSNVAYIGAYAPQ